MSSKSAAPSCTVSVGLNGHHYAGAVRRLVPARMGAALAFVAMVLLSGYAPSAYAQLCPIPGSTGPNASLSGFINEYFPGTASVSAGATTLTVGTSRRGGTVAPGDLLLVIQMQDAAIDSTNTDAYGDGAAGAPANGSTSIGQSGLYEYVIATGVSGSSVTVFGEGSGNGLVNGYTSAPGTNTRGQRTFQVVRVPQYSSVTLTGDIFAPTWNGSTGGVLAIEVAGDLTFSGGKIDLEGQGFRGAGGVLLLGDAGESTSDVAVPYGPLPNKSHGTKGEGIAGTPTYTSACFVGFCGPISFSGTAGYPGNGAGIGYDNGRGAPGNAGGGGNEDYAPTNGGNAGGGGGGNYGAGGQGGDAFCIGNVGCKTVGGFGGAAYGTAVSASRIFMGGGGGSGSTDEGTGNGADGRASGGAPGGGIAFIRVGRVMGTGTITARGQSADNSVTDDGAGGGGAGGSVLLYAANPGTNNVTIDVSGGNGGSNTGAFQPHGPGGGGGGGFVLASGVSPTILAGAGANGVTTGSIAYGAAAGSAGAGGGALTAAQFVGLDPSSSAGCRPLLAATKTTSTPTLTASTGATATYTITVNNTGGPAQGVAVIENALPPGWTLTGTPVYAYSPAPPLGGGVLSAGAESVAATTTFPLRADGAAPGTVPAGGANSLNWGTFFIPRNGSVAITYTVAVPDVAAVGTYHTPVGITMLDPTRATAGRLVTPSVNAAANRAAVAYSANTTFETGANAPQSVGGSNYSGLEAGPTGDDVRLLPDLSLALTHTGSLIPGAGGQSYTLTPRNNGRAIRPLDFATDQATTVALPAVPASLGANPIAVTDAFQTGVTLSAAPTGTNWTCAGAVAGNTNFNCTYANASAYPLSAATDLPALSIPVNVASTACPGPGNNTATVATASGETITANNTATDATAIACGQAIDVVKSLNPGVSQVSATVFDVAYRIQVKNTGGIDAPNVQAVENLAATFATGAPTLAWAAAPAVAAIAPATAGQCALNPAFVTAPSATNVFDGRQVVPAGGSCVVTFTVRVTYPTTAAVATTAQSNSVVATSYANPAAAAGGTGTTVLATDTSTNSATPPAAANSDAPSATPVTLAGIDLQVANVLNGPLTVGQPGGYTLTPRNAGGAPTSGPITIVDTLPAGLQFVSAAGTGWTCTVAAQTVTCTSSSVIPGNASGSPITLNVSVLSAAVPANSTTANVTNTATVSGGSEPAGAAGNNTAATTSAVSVPGATSGSVWRDLNNNRIKDGGESPLAGWKVEILDPNTGTIVKTTTTGADGQYALTGLPTGSYRLRFRDPVNNVIYGTPVNGEQGAGSAQAGSTVAPDRSGLIVTIAPGQTLSQQSMPIDPSGIVYDTDTRQPLFGATVQMCGPAGFAPATQLVGGGSYTVAGQCASMVTSGNGFYQFLLAAGAPAGTYTVAVTPPAGYATSTITAAPGPLTPPAGTGLYAVQAQASPPVGAQPTTYYTSLSLATNRQDVVNNHIPLDPSVRAIIVTEKRANVTEAEIGDLILYTVTVRSIQGGGLSQLSFVDRLPAGFRYVPGTARAQFSGAVAPVLQPDPAGGVGPVVTFDVANPAGLVLTSGGTMTLTYRVRVAVGAAQGDGINHIVASTGRTTSNEATVRVKVAGGVFTTDACVVGKVYLDCNDNRKQDKGEAGVPGVRLYFEDGTYLVSDGEGKYSLCGLRPTTHVLKADSTTLPLGARLGIVDNRNALDADSAFVDLKNGELHRTDFILRNCAAGVLDQVQQRRKQLELNAARPVGGPAGGRAGSVAAPAGNPPERCTRPTPDAAPCQQEVRP